MRNESVSRHGQAPGVSRRRLLGGAAVGVVGLGLAGCSTPAASAPTSVPAAVAPTAPAAAAPAATPTVPAPKRGGTLKLAYGTTARNLDPHGNGGLGAWGTNGPYICYSQLLVYKWGADVKPPSYVPYGDLAESWTQPDDLTYVFKLRPGAKWHNIAPVNGRELVAEDIVYSYQRIRDQKVYAGFLAGIAKTEAVDKATLKLTLDKPNADLLNSLSQQNLVIVAKERDQQTGGNLDELPVIGSGPFILDSIKMNERFVAKRNPDYHFKGLPYIDAYDTVQLPDPSNQVSAIRSGTIQVIPSGVTIQMAEDIQKSVPGANILYIPADRNPPELILNHYLDTFKDVRVRQAINKAIDRKAIIDTVWKGRGQLTTGLSLPDPSYSLPDAELNRLLGRDVEGAKKLLKDAGRDQGLSFEIIAPDYLAGAFVSLTEIIQANLKEIGVTATIKTADTAAVTAAQSAGNYTALTGTFAGSAPNAWLATRFRTGGGQNWSKYSDPEMDRMIDQQAVMAKDPEGRKKVLQDIQRKIINDAVYIPLLQYQSPTVSLAEVKDLYPPLGAHGHTRVWDNVWINK
jgi:peptide/nickel transport system substrate-binding protein